MEVSKEEDLSLKNVIRLSVAFGHYLVKKWWLFLIVISAGGVIGAIYCSLQRPKYEAVTTFILEEKSAGGSGLAGLASQFGFNIGNLNGGGNLFAGDNILDILRSKKVVQHVLLSYVDEARPNQGTLADLFLDFTRRKKRWKDKQALAKISFTNTKHVLTPLQDSVLNVVYEAVLDKHLLTDRFRKQSTIIKVQVTAENSLFARLMAQRLVDEASKLYLDIKTGTAEANILQMQRRSDSLLYLLNRKSYTAASSQPLDINPGIKAAIVPMEIATRDKTVLATLYAEVTKNLEASKLLLSQQTPVIQKLDTPGVLLDDHKKSRFFWVLVFSIIAGFIYIFGALSRFMFSRLKLTAN